MIRYKVEKRKLEPHKITKQREQAEFPLPEMKVKEHFAVPLTVAQAVRNRIQELQRKTKKRFITRTTPDKRKIRVWRTA